MVDNYMNSSNRNSTRRKCTQTMRSIFYKKLFNWKVIFVCVLLLFYLSTRNGKVKDTPKNHNLSPAIYHSEDNATKIVVATLYRSGSSFIGEILKHIPNSFYAFEPLMYLHLNEFSLYARNDTILTPKLTHYLSHIVNCNYNLVVNDSFKFFPGNNWYRDWWTNTTGFPGYNSIETAKESCLKKQYRINKIIRAYYISDIASLMAHNVTIIHLVRDPRASIYSATKEWTGRLDFTQNRADLHIIRKDIVNICHVLRTNLQFIHNYITRYKNYRSNYLFIRYEDFAFSPQHMLTKLYDYLGVNVHMETLEWIKTITAHNSGDSYATMRDSKEAASQWRMAVPFEIVKMIQNECHEAIEGYGYEILTNESILRNFSVPVFSKVPERTFQSVKFLDMF